MSTKSQNSDNQEIDLSEISKNIGGFFDNILTSIFNVILFIKKNITIIGLLFVLGIGLGFFLDSQKNYNSQIILTPNGSSVDYLYSKIDLLESRLKENDKEFFNSIGIVNSDQISSIKIEPIIDLYNFVNNNTAIVSNAQNTQNFEVIKLLAESNDINTVIKDKLTSKNYPYHSLVINSNGRIDKDKIIKPVLKFLNTDSYMSEISRLSKENIVIKMKKNEEQIFQLDSLISNISKNIGQNSKGNNLIYNNENNQLNGLFELKNKLIDENAYHKIQLVKIESFIKDISIIPNIVNSKGINGKMKLILPVVFLTLFFLISLFISFYKNQLSKSKQ